MRKLLLLIILSFLIFASPVDVKSTIGNGGGRISDGANENQASIGQPITGKASSEEYIDVAGYITATAHITLSVDDDEPIYKNQKLIVLENRPNPFNERTRIQFRLYEQMDISLEVINLRGQKVFEFSQKQIPPGAHSVLFEAGNLPDGIYLYKIKAGELEIQKKMTLIN